MNAYLDSSVLLRFILGQANALTQWRSIERGVASELVQVECLRTLDRLRLLNKISDSVVAERRETVFRLIEDVDCIDVGSSVLTRASQPMPVTLGTLDAIHLATALMWREAKEMDLVMATHDRALALGSRAFGFRVVGVD